MGVTSTLVRQPGMIPCKPCMTIGLHCIEVSFNMLIDVFVKTCWRISFLERESTCWNSWKT
jgi:hypothetical protein